MAIPLASYHFGAAKEAPVDENIREALAGGASLNSGTGECT